MSASPRLSSLLRPSVMGAVGWLRFRVPFVGAVADRVARPLRHGPRTIRYGVGAGLRFDPHGGNASWGIGTSEGAEQEALARYLTPGSVFYDVGANKGFYAVLGARLVGPEGRVFAFEPFPESARAIRSNVALNGFENVVVRECAVSGRSGRDRLLLTDDSFEFRLASSPTAMEDQTRGVDVEVAALDDLVEAGEIAPPDVVLLDVEGAEAEAIRGLARTIRAHRPVIIAEVHWLVNEIDAVVEEVLRPAGYTAQRLGGGPLPTEPIRYHALFLPPGR